MRKLIAVETKCKIYQTISNKIISLLPKDTKLIQKKDYCN